MYFLDYLSYSIDAFKEDGSLGHLANNKHMNPNGKMKKKVVEGRPHLYLFAGTYFQERKQCMTMVIPLGHGAQ